MFKEQILPEDVSKRQTQINDHETGKALLPKIAAHTNIWGIGAIMFELWLHEPVAHYLVDMALKDVPDAHNPRYSSTLTDLIKICLMKEPRERPRLEELELKIGAKCQSISTEYVANPSLIEHERLYYKGSEINQMPPGEGIGNYWRPKMEVLTNPSAYSGPDLVKNPFTARIIYPPRPGVKNDGPQVAEGEAQKRTDGVESNKGLGNKGARKLKTGAGAENPIALSDEDGEDGAERERGALADNPIVHSDDDEEDGVEKERGDVSDRDGDEVNGSEDEDDGVEGERGDVSDRDGDGSNDSEDRSSSERKPDDSDDSDDSDTRRRIAIKKPVLS